MQHEEIWFLFGLSVGAISVGCNLYYQKIIAWWHRRKESEFRRGFLYGLDLGAKNHAAWISVHDGIPANGFAASCDRCGSIQECILNEDAEWWSCKKCNHRQGAPLCPMDEEVVS